MHDRETDLLMLVTRCTQSIDAPQGMSGRIMMHKTSMMKSVLSVLLKIDIMNMTWSMSSHVCIEGSSLL